MYAKVNNNTFMDKVFGIQCSVLGFGYFPFALVFLSYY